MLFQIDELRDMAKKNNYDLDIGIRWAPLPAAMFIFSSLLVQIILLMTGQNCRRSRSTWIPCPRTLWASSWDTSTKKKPPWTADTWTSHACTLYGAGVGQPDIHLGSENVRDHHDCQVRYKWINILYSGPHFKPLWEKTQLELGFSFELLRKARRNDCRQQY